MRSVPPKHSGGEEVLLDVAGQDATEAFEDVGHSDEARETLDQLIVGTLKRQVRFESHPPPPGAIPLPRHSRLLPAIHLRVPVTAS